jgi:hypothetical protein
MMSWVVASVARSTSDTVISADDHIRRLKLQISECRLQIADCRLQIAD